MTQYVNIWTTDLAPTQKEISDAQQKEQFLSLTQDAPAARKVRQAIQQRAEEAKVPFQRASVGYQYDQPPSEEAIRSKLTGLMATDQMLKSKADQALVMRSAARLGRGAKASDIINATDQSLGNAATTSNRMLTAQQDALKEFAARQQLHQQQWGDPMKMWGDLMAQGGNIPNIPHTAFADPSGDMASKMASAFQSGTSGIGRAMNAVGTALGKSPDLDPLAKLLAGIGKSQRENPASGDNQDNQPVQGGYSIAAPTIFGGSDSSYNDYGTTYRDSTFGG